MTFNEEPRDPSTVASPKKRWNAPRLQRYGTLVHLTETNSPGMGLGDGGGPIVPKMQNRTH